MKELQKANKKEFRIEMIIKRKGGNTFVKWKGDDSSFTSWIDKNSILDWKLLFSMKMSQYLPKPFTNFGGNINVKVDFSNYAIKADI